MDLKNLLRYIHLGATDNYYTAKNCKINIENAALMCAFLNGDEAADPIWPLVAIRKAIANKSLPRHDEAIFLLAYCTRRLKNQTLKDAIHKAIPDILTSTYDFFLFVRFISDLNGNQCFGRGMKTCVKNWYAKKTPVELANMIGKNRKRHNWTHKDIIHLAHLKFEDDNDKKQIIDSQFQRGVKILNDETIEGTQPEGIRRLKDIFRLKICEKPKDAAEMIESYQFSIEHAPSHLQHFSEVWEAALPTLSYMELIKYIPMLNDLKLLKQNTNFTKKFVFALTNVTAITESKIYPIQLLIVLRSYETQKRFCEPCKETFRENKISKLNIEANPRIIKALQSALNISFNYFPKTGVKYFITIDIRRGNFKKSIFGEKHLSCVEVSILLALSLCKREKDVTVMTFTTVDGVLKNVPFTKDMTYEKAFTLCEKLQHKYTSKSLTSPFLAAQKIKKKYDVFITMVDSIKRFLPNGEIPIPEINSYKKHVNIKHTKYIVVNLSRHTPDLINPMNYNDILEINGFNMCTPKVIESFAKNQFT